MQEVKPLAQDLIRTLALHSQAAIHAAYSKATAAAAGAVISRHSRAGK